MYAKQSIQILKFQKYVEIESYGNKLEKMSDTHESVRIFMVSQTFFSKIIFWNLKKDNYNCPKMKIKNTFQ